MTDVNDNEIHVVESSPSVGKRLQQAREAKKFTVAEVAVQLRLNKDIVVALEKQQWEKLHGRTYARGYFTHYVKFLGLPQDELLAAFNIEYTVLDNEPKLTVTNVATESQFPWVPVIVLILVMLVGWFAYQQWRATQEEQATQTQQSSSANDNAAPEDNFSPSVVQPLDNAASPSTSASTAEQTVAPTEPSQAPAAATKPVQTTKPVSPQTSIQPQTDTSVQTQTAQQKTKSLLEMAFTDKCWVQVKDGSSNILVNKVMNANDELKLSATPPVHVMLGKASVATVKFNDKPVDISSYIQGDVARFTLGANS